VAEANNQTLEKRLAQLERLCATEMEAMDTLQAKLQECNHADMGGGVAAAKSAALLRRLEGLSQELKSKTEALENLEVIRLRLEGQLADNKAACEKFDEEAKDTIMCDVVVLLGKEELLEFGETSRRR
jgi:chaperonin cofactor prefoldin